MYLGGINILNGNGLKAGANQATKIMLGSTQVWINNYAPDAPTGFNATDDQAGQVTVTFIPSTDPGVPACTYDLYENNVLVASSITSGYVHSVAAGTYDYKVKAVNIAGTVDSNVNSGLSKAAAGSQTFTSSGTFTIPIGYTSVTVCMVGGGGGGSQGGYHKAGGYAGTINNQVVLGTSGQTISVTVGSGGAGARGTDNNSRAGSAGSASVFGSVTASGGGGGSASNSANQPYYGHGVSRTTCGGTGTDGSQSNVGGWTASGGQSSGFGNGGNGNRVDYGTAGSGGVGSGGGGARHYAGDGGRGEVRVSWS